MFLTIRRLYKATIAAPGETHVWADGKSHKKVGKKWVTVKTAGGKTRSVMAAETNTRIKGEEYFDYAMATNLGDSIESILQSEGVDSYEKLVEKVKTGGPNAAHKLYKKLVDRIGAGPGTTVEKGAALHLIGTTLVELNKQYGGPKVKTTVKVRSKTGGEYYGYEETEDLPTLKASAVATAKKKMGGWSVTGPLDSKHVRAMIKTKAAKLVSGKINASRKWHLPKKAEDMEIKYKGNYLLIRVKQIKKVDERTRATAKAEIKIPYAFAKAYLQNQVESKKTANNLIFRMEHSSGYRDFLAKKAA